MHKYSILNNSRENRLNAIYIGIAVLGLVLTIIINTLIQILFGRIINMCVVLEKYINIINLLNLIPSVSFFFVLAWLKLKFDNKFWKLLNKFIGIPNINGSWNGKLQSSYGVNIAITMDICQNLNKMQVTCYFNESTSKSCMAALDVQNFLTNDSWKLSFSYFNQNVNDDKHFGFNVIECKQNIASKKYQLKGTYFTNRIRANDNDKGTYGTFSLEKC